MRNRPRPPAALAAALAALLLGGIQFGAAAEGAGAKGTAVVFATQNKLLAISPDGSSRRLLSRLPAGTADVAASANGRRFALIVNRTLPYPESKQGSLRTLYLLRLGHGMRRVRRFPARGPLDIALSPRGDQVAFVKGAEIWTLDLGSGVETHVTDGAGVASEPAYTPSGSALLFVRSGFRVTETGLMRIRIGGKHERPVGEPEGRMPAVARDGRIAFFRDAEGEVPYRLVVMDPDGSDKRTVAMSNDPIFDTDPAFSPDGRHLAYRRLHEHTGYSESYRYSFWTVSDEGRDRRRLIAGLRVTPGQGGPIGPLWVPAP